MANLQEVNEIFPELRSLYYRSKRVLNVEQRNGTDKDIDAIEIVRFQNVESYMIDLLGYDCDDDNRSFCADTLAAKLSSIGFDRLASLGYLTLEGFNINSSDQIDFVAQYKDIKRLNFSSYEMSFEEVKYLVDELPNLEEITIRPSRGMEEFVKFMTETN